MKVAIPSNAPGGLDAAVSDHFGHCDFFTVVEVEGQEIGEVSVLTNDAHDKGGCMGPVMFLKEQGADSLVAGGMGMRPLQGFHKVGITVYAKEAASTVRDALLMVMAGKGREMSLDEVCGGEDGHCGGHHEPVKREVIDGPVEKDRVVILKCQLTDTDGNIVDDTETIPYLHGYNQLPPGVEKTVEGMVAGDKATVTVTPADGYGERDDERIFDIPRENLPPDVHVGAMLQGRTPTGGMMPLTVLALDAQKATLDGNHPLAGKTLVFNVEVLEVQAATPEELAQTHSHSEGSGCC
jgi:FKBP-type peptidyl-prolyl cis-trans isomerase SlyD